ncbi:ABC transporter ATP-binding protein [Ruminococcaceae bacterium OttesenSCG-928-D13]|nr:ABC transporter ATP-binding protein [Ruminococcaceae bacterium OttesenSCG-928-D13]
MKGISKYFGSFCALDEVNLNVRKGSIHALLGENGAGKSTLMNVLYGLYAPEKGEIVLNGKPTLMKNPRVAIQNGVGMVHQHFMLVENFTIAQNIMLGSETTKKLDILDVATVRKQILELGEKYGLAVDPDQKIQDVSVATQQRVEILKALYRGAEILILDEPTAVLTPQEIEELIATLHHLVADNKTIIIITHKLKEIKQSSEWCTIIRRGKYVDTVKVADTTQEELANMMVGRQVSLHVEKSPATPGEVIFNVNGLKVCDHRGIEKVQDVNLTLRSGEILGVAGIDGNGQTELVDALCGLTRANGGTISIHGKEVQNTSPRNIRDCCISAIPEDRQKDGLVMSFTVAENMVLDNYNSKEFSSRGILNLKKMVSHATQLIEQFDIRPAGSEQTPARSLSGGNQQKVIVAREVYNDPELLIAVQPTRGLDVGAIEFVHKALIEQRDRGKAILLISFELDEILDLSDRISVIYDGRIVGELKPEETDEKEIGLLMAGGGGTA